MRAEFRFAEDEKPKHQQFEIQKLTTEYKNQPPSKLPQSKSNLDKF